MDVASPSLEVLLQADNACRQAPWNCVTFRLWFNTSGQSLKLCISNRYLTGASSWFRPLVNGEVLSTLSYDWVVGLPTFRRFWACNWRPRCDPSQIWSLLVAGDFYNLYLYLFISLFVSFPINVFFQLKDNNSVSHFSFTCFVYKHVSVFSKILSVCMILECCWLLVVVNSCYVSMSAARVSRGRLSCGTVSSVSQDVSIEIASVWETPSASWP